MPLPRSVQVDPNLTPYYHVISRCVRRAWLCGDDAYSGRNFDHRKEWFVERLTMLAQTFAIDICAYAVMSNHFHLVVRLDPDRAGSWATEEIVARYNRVFSGTQAAFDAMNRAEQEAAVARWRQRLRDLSWMMRCLNEYIARRANNEDECRGRFWEGRFVSQALLDEGALLACMSYVDLNPVRAGITKSLETSEFTSIRERLRGSSQSSNPTVPEGLAPMVGERPRAGQSSERLPISLLHYAELLDWTGRALVRGKRGRVEGESPRLLTQQGLAHNAWLETVQGVGKQFATAVGAPSRLDGAASSRGTRWCRGKKAAKRMYAEG